MGFPNNCLPRIINVDATTGCSLTRATIQAMTPQVFANQNYTEIGMDKIIQRSREARAAGVVESTLEMLLMSSLKSIKGELTRQPIGPNESVILPYIYRRQKRNIQSNYWAVTAAVATPGAGTGSIAASSTDLTVTFSYSPYASPLNAPEQYFLTGKYIVVETVDPTTKVAYSLLYAITSAANVNPTTAKVTAVPNYSAAGWAALSGPQQGTYLPTKGLAYLLQNSVSDYESWCNQDVAENTNKLLTYWLQTSRETHKYTDEYLKALNAALTSGYFKDFRELPLAEQKRILHAKWTRDWINSVFYGDRINENQTVETYAQLPQVVDPNNSGCVLEYKANALGFYPQLANCGQVFDHQGNPLSIDNLAQVGYNLKRAREATGGTVERIDFGTDRFTAGAILQIMSQFYKAKYGTNIERFYQPNQELTFEKEVMLRYNVYQLPEDLGGYELAIYTDQFFSDKLSAFDPSINSRGRTLWGIDWSDFTLGIGATNSAVRQTNIYDNLYNCVITPNITHYMLNSTTWTTIVEDPARHQIITNFSNGCPVLTVPGCDLKTS